MKVSAVIPAKGHSERVSNKNLQKVGGKRLVRLACEKLLACENIHEVYIDTEDERIKSAVRPLFGQGLNLLNRPPQLATNDIGANEMFVYAMHTIDETDLLIHHYCTTPLIESETIDECINEFINKQQDHDSFFTVCPVEEYFWTDESEPMNFDLDELPNSQDLDTVYQETHGLYGIKTQALIKQQRRVGKNPLLIPISRRESFDIDTSEDLEIVRQLADID